MSHRSWFSGSLFPHQVEHAKRLGDVLASAGYGIDASETGSGKTVVALHLACAMRSGEVTVLCPNALTGKWEREFERLGGRSEDAPAFCAHSFSLLRSNATERGLIQYGSRKRPRVKRTVSQGAFLIVDEAHHAKHASSQTTAGVKAFVKSVLSRGGMVLHLSATPVDHLTQVANLVDLVCAGDVAGRGAKLLAACAHISPPSSWTPLSLLMAASGVEDESGGREAVVRRCLNRLIDDPAWTKPLRAVGLDWDRVNHLGTAATLLRHFCEALCCGGGRRDFAIRRKIVFDLLPRIMCKMERRVCEQRRYLCDLFLDDACAAAEVEACMLGYYYMRAQPSDAAPLCGPPPGCAKLPDDVVSRAVTSPAQWTVGAHAPVRAWCRAVEGARGHAELHRSASAALALCERGWEGLWQTVEQIKGAALVPTVETLTAEISSVKVVLIFNYLKTMMDVSARLGAARIHGDVPMEERRDILRRFNRSGSEVGVLCATLQTLKEGLDLHDTTGSSPRVMFLMPSFHGQSLAQVSGRTLRVGGRSHTMVVTVYSGHAEAKMVAALRRRGATMRSFGGATDAEALEWERHVKCYSSMDVVETAEHIFAGFSPPYTIKPTSKGMSLDYEAVGSEWHRKDDATWRYECH